MESHAEPVQPADPARKRPARAGVASSPGRPAPFSGQPIPPTLLPLLEMQQSVGNQAVLRFLDRYGTPRDGAAVRSGAPGAVVQRHVDEEEPVLERLVQRAPTETALKSKFQQPPEVVAAQRAPMLAEAITQVRAAMDGIGGLIDVEVTKSNSPERAELIRTNQATIDDDKADAQKKAAATAYNKKYRLAAAQLPGLAGPRGVVQGKVDALGPASTVVEIRAAAADVNTFGDQVKQVVTERTMVSQAQAALGEAEKELKKAEAITGDIVGGGFGSDMRSHIGKALGALPTSHVKGNASFKGIEDATANPEMGAASFYSSDSGKLSIVRPDSPFGGKMGEGLYTSLSKGVGFQLNAMDAGAMAGYKGVAGSEDLGLGARKVMGGSKSKIQPHIDALTHGKLVDWTLRHETGHSVDEQIKFTDKRAKVAAFGGWKQHDGAEVTTAMLAKAPALSPPSLATLRPIFTTLFDTEHGALVTELARIEGLLDNPPTGEVAAEKLFDTWAKTASKADRDALKPAVRWARTAVAVPWSTADGQQAALEVNGRVYQLDHYGTWVSYLVGARANAVSNYQFSTAGEWFAEAYAAFYDPEKKSAGALNDATRNWFLQNLGAPQDKTAQADGALSKNGVLGQLTDLGAGVDPEALQDEDLADLPADLKATGGAALMAGMGTGVAGTAAAVGGRGRSGAVSL